MTLKSDWLLSGVERKREIHKKVMFSSTVEESKREKKRKDRLCGSILAAVVVLFLRFLP